MCSTEPVSQARLLRDCDEDARRHRSTDGVGPAREGLHTHRPQAVGVVDGLVVPSDRVAVEGLTQLGLHAHPFHELGLSTGVAPGETATACVLGAVQRNVSVAEHAVERCPGRSGGQSDAGGDREGPSVELDRRAEGVEQAAGDRFGCRRVASGQDHGELVAFEPSDELSGPQRL